MVRYGYHLLVSTVIYKSENNRQINRKKYCWINQLIEKNKPYIKSIKKKKTLW